MGQYYHPISLEGKSTLYSHDFGNGLKLMEHSWVGNDFVEAVEKLLSPTGQWYKTRLVWAGDYMDEGIFVTDEMRQELSNHKDKIKDEFGVEDETELATIIRDISLYSYSNLMYAELKPADIEKLPNEIGDYIVNYTKKQFVDKRKGSVEEVYNNFDWIVHPLPLLTSSGNGRGGGDFRGLNEFVGYWAGDVIAIEKEIPADFLEILPMFSERTDEEIKLPAELKGEELAEQVKEEESTKRQVFIIDNL